MGAAWHLTEGGQIMVEEGAGDDVKAHVMVADDLGRIIVAVRMDTDVAGWLNNTVTDYVQRAKEDRGDLTDSEFKIYKKLKDKLERRT